MGRNGSGVRMEYANMGGTADFAIRPVAEFLLRDFFIGTQEECRRKNNAMNR